MELVFNSETQKWQEPYSVYHTLSKEEDDKLRKTIKRGSQMRWHSADLDGDDLPEEAVDVLLCYSSETDRKDHVYCIGQYWPEEVGYDDEEPCPAQWFTEHGETGRPDTIVHGWMPLPDFFPEE